MQSDIQITFDLQMAGIKTKIIKMNTSAITGNWNERKAKLKKKFGYLTDNDLMFEETNKEEMIAKLQVKLGKTKEELLRIIGVL